MRRIPPLAAAIALMAAALLATVWSTRNAVSSASRAVGDGDAIALQQALRADFADLGGPPTDADLGELLRQHAAEGLRYVATLDARGTITAAAGQPLGKATGRIERGVHVERLGDRLRVELRASFRRAWGAGGRPWWIVIELEPVHADALEDAAERSLAIGAIAAVTLLIVAGALVRRELRRRAEEKARERERRLASLGEMSAVLAHEIRNPLASLKGNAQLLAAMLPQGEKPRGKADRVVEEALRLERLTTDLLAFVKTGELHKTDADPTQLVRDLDADVDVTAAPKTWSMDAARLGQVISNLVDNARDAGPPVSVRVAEEQGRLVIEVSDKGPGVPAADREKIFEPFHTGKTRGTGLGLAIARRVVEAHGGTISVSDAPGGGARFRVEVP